MKISNNWLKDFIKTDLATDKIGAFLRDIGLEVDGIEQFESVKGSFDMVMANLVAPLLLRIRKDLCANSSNLLLVSGIFETMFAEVIEAFGKEGFEKIEGRSSGEWRSGLFARRR